MGRSLVKEIRADTLFETYFLPLSLFSEICPEVLLPVCSAHWIPEGERCQIGIKTHWQNAIGSRLRLTNNSPKTQQLLFYFDLVHVFGVRFDKPWPTCYRGFHFLTKRTQVCAYTEVGQRPDQNSLAFLPYHAHTCWHFASCRPPTLGKKQGYFWGHVLFFEARLNLFHVSLMS